MKRQAKPHSMAKSSALSTRAKPSRPMPISVLRCSGVIAMLVRRPLKSTPTPRPTVPMALNDSPAAMYSAPPTLTGMLNEVSHATQSHYIERRVYLLREKRKYTWVYTPELTVAIDYVDDLRFSQQLYLVYLLTLLLSITMQPKAITELINMYYSRCRVALYLNNCKLLSYYSRCLRCTPC